MNWCLGGIGSLYTFGEDKYIIIRVTDMWINCCPQAAQHMLPTMCTLYSATGAHCGPLLTAYKARIQNPGVTDVFYFSLIWLYSIFIALSLRYFFFALSPMYAFEENPNLNISSRCFTNFLQTLWNKSTSAYISWTIFCLYHILLKWYFLLPCSL